ncbi:hypothetical protein LGH83_01090 [Lichenihabitans sp. PAMC28606]|uniref:hypothetical protein n=1 Tax=Lichenihabitans sp. PAMC28606 TaxID=2880932 RepID=UPI001D0A7BCA|nr:hypothetical protein [Lichenihabitans sp. PAMC28606]UDL94905.1 hypothetical protein LGH83_01090 [Lichenihabitans sp. PAMC28606]
MRDSDQFGTHFTPNDNRLIGEAVRRAVALRFNAETERDAIVAAVVAEAGRGTRSMFGLVRAASRTTPTFPAV